MYDYLAKIILLGPSGTGKYAHSPLAHLDTSVLTLFLQVLSPPSLRQE